MRFTTLSVLVVMLLSGVALADRFRGGSRPVIRDHRNTSVYGGASVRVRGGYDRVGPSRYNGPTRQDRRVVQRRPLYATGGRFTFRGGVSVNYRRPVIDTRYYDYNVRPQVFVESYPQQNGYLWVNGTWSWTGYEWTWTAGYYAPDPSVQNYYDDGSYDSYNNNNNNNNYNNNNYNNDYR